jgi:hypothetical protein
LFLISSFNLVDQLAKPSPHPWSRSSYLSPDNEQYSYSRPSLQWPTARSLLFDIEPPLLCSAQHWPACPDRTKPATSTSLDIVPILFVGSVCSTFQNPRVCAVSDPSSTSVPWTASRTSRTLAILDRLLASFFGIRIPA